LIIANLFGRCNGYLVGSVDVHRSKVVLNTLTPLGFSLGRSVTLEMSEFAGLRLKMDLDEKGFDDFIVTLAHANGGDDVRLGEIDINGKGFVRKSGQKTKFVGKHELASLAMRQLAADLNLRIENPAMLADDDPAPRVPVDPTPQPAAASQPRPAEDDHENYNF
jgi:hypothetical protein